MGLYEFSLLSRELQLKQVLRNGQFLAERNENNFQSRLFHLDRFFVEVIYDPQTEEILKHRTFVTHKLLEPFAPDNLLHELLSLLS